MRNIVLALMLSSICTLGFASTKNVVPRADSEGSLGTDVKKWQALYVDNIYGGEITADGVIYGSMLWIDGYLYGDGSNLTGVSTSGGISGLNTGYIPKASSATTIADSIIYQTGTMIGIGTTAPDANFPKTKLVASNGSSGHTYIQRIGIVGESLSEVGYPGIGVGGVAKSNGIFPAYGVAGRALVDASGSSGTAVGVEGLSESTHIGGSNIGFYSIASGGLLNYSFYGNTGDIYNNGNASFVGALKLSSSGILGDRFIVTSTGNVGINVVSPAYSLEVNGTIYTGNDLTVGNVTKNYATSSPDLFVKSNAEVDGTLYANEIVVPDMALGNPTYYTINDWTNSFGSAGRKTGGALSAVGDSTIAVSAGTGFIKATDDDNAQLLFFNFPAPSNITIPADSIRYIGVEYNGGNPQVVSRETYNWDFDSEFPLGRVVNEKINGVPEIYIANTPWWVTDGTTNIIQAIRSFGLVRRDEAQGGLIVSVSGTRDIAVTSGKVWAGLNDYDFAGLDTSVTGNFEYYWYKAGSGWQKSDATQYSVTQWNDTTLTALQTIANNKYCNVWVYGELNASSTSISILYPQAQYTTAAEAEATGAPPVVPSHLSYNGFLIGRIIIKQGVNAPIEVQSAFGTTFAGSVTTDHGNLAGLSDDDHTQYLLRTDATIYALDADLNSYVLETDAALYAPKASPTFTGTVTAQNVGIGTASVTNNLLVSGNIGIGTALPRSELDVDGSVYINGSMIINSSSASYLVPTGATTDPCASKSEGTAFYNSTGHYWCYCDTVGADVVIYTPSQACF